MNLKSLLLAAPLALAACGSTDAAHTMSSGLYTGSDSHAVNVTDNCIVGTIYNGAYDLPWVVDSDGKGASIFLGSSNDFAHTIGVAIDGNALTGTKASTDVKVVTGQDSTDCTYDVTTTILSGELVDDKTVHLVLRYDAAERVSGSCSATELEALTAGSCSSQVDFLGTRSGT